MKLDIRYGVSSIVIVITGKYYNKRGWDVLEEILVYDEIDSTRKSEEIEP